MTQLQQRLRSSTYILMSRGELIRRGFLLVLELLLLFVGTFGQLGVAGLSASLLTSVLPTTLEDLLALGICSAGGWVMYFIQFEFFYDSSGLYFKMHACVILDDTLILDPL